MRYLELKRLLKGNIFDMVDVENFSPPKNLRQSEPNSTVSCKRDSCSPLKRGLYCFEKSKIDEFSEIRQERTKGDSYRIGSRI